VARRGLRDLVLAYRGNIARQNRPGLRGSDLILGHKNAFPFKNAFPVMP